MHIKVDLRVWRCNYRFAGKQKTLTVGRYPEITLKEARARHEQARSLRERGIDLFSHKKQLIENRAAKANTFENVTSLFFAPFWLRKRQQPEPG